MTIILGLLLLIRIWEWDPLKFLVKLLFFIDDVGTKFSPLRLSINFYGIRPYTFLKTCTQNIVKLWLINPGNTQTCNQQIIVNSISMLWTLECINWISLLDLFGSCFVTTKQIKITKVNLLKSDHSGGTHQGLSGRGCLSKFFQPIGLHDWFILVGLNQQD